MSGSGVALSTGRGGWEVRAYAVAVDAITRADAAGYYRHCGYHLGPQPL